MARGWRASSKGKGPDEDGVALLVTICVFALLVVLVASFARLSRLEALAGSAEVDGTRARMLSAAGIEYAAAKLLRDAASDGFQDPAAPWRYGGGPLESSHEPSYAGGETEGWTWSGSLGGTYAEDGDHFALAIQDASSGLDLNLPVPAFAGMLDELGRGIREERLARGDTAIDPIRGRGERIVEARRSRGRFTSTEQLLDVLGEADFEIVEPYVTVHARVDPSTIAPTGERLADGRRAFEIEPRAPVDVNGASRPVLLAVLAGVAGPSDPAITHPDAGALADAILERRVSPIPGRGPFRSWSEFYDFVLGLAQGLSPTITTEQAWALLVNADPNFHPSWLNAERIVNPPIDKTDLAGRTTEFCFRPGGTFRIVSLGRVVDGDGQIRSAAKASAVVRVFGVLQHSVQADFERYRASDRAEQTTTFPNPPRSAGGEPAAWAGHVQLQTDRPAPDLLAGTPSFEALFRDGLVAEKGPAPEPLTEQVAGPDAAESSDLLPDGLLFSPARGRLTAYEAQANLPAPEGSIEFWMKLDRQSDIVPVPILFATRPTTTGAGVQHRIRTRTEGDALLVESTRLYYGASSTGGLLDLFQAPCLFAETTWLAVVPGAGIANEWHHVAVAWRDHTFQTLFVDGRPGTLVSATPSGSGADSTGWPPYQDLMTIGGAVTDERGREVAAVTIDDLRIRGGTLALPPTGFVRSRFEPLSPLVAGRFAGAFDAVDRPIRILGVYWTEWIPRTYSGLPLPNLPLPIEVGLDLGAGLLPVLSGPLGGLLETLGLAVVVEHHRIAYEIRFHHTPTVLPLNVTPVLDDLTLEYWPGRYEFLSYQWLVDG